MAGAKETAIGIASVLGLEDSPNPFLLTFQGQLLAEAADIIQLTVAECRDAGIQLSRLELDPDLFDELEGDIDVPLRLCPDLVGGVRFVRGSTDR
jgi:hypothetical protein